MKLTPQNRSFAVSPKARSGMASSTIQHSRSLPTATEAFTAQGSALPSAGVLETPRSVTPPKEVVRVALKCEAKHFRPLAVRILDQKAEVEKR